MMDLTTNQILVSPIVTEKTVAIPGKYTFIVHNSASKSMVKGAIKEFYGVEPESVNMSAIRSKSRMVGRGKFATKRRTQKKAIVTLKSGETLNFNDFK